MLFTPIRTTGHLTWLIPAVLTVTACTTASDPNPAGGNGDKDEGTVPTTNDFTLISVNDQLWRTDADGNAEVVAYLNNSTDGNAFHNEVETVLLNQYTFFAASDGIHGTELWRFDGSDPVMVKDINPGSPHSYPSDLVTLESTLYFLAFTADTGQELWRSDGTEDGTWLVKEFRPGIEDGFPNSFHSNNQIVVAAEQQLYLLVESDADTLSLWSSDGTSDGTQWVMDLNRYHEHRLIPNGNDLYLLELTDNDVTLRYIDGETHQPIHLGDTYTTDDSTVATAFINGQLHLLVGKDRSQLWRSDGTAEGTTLQFDNGVRCGTEPSIPVLGDALFVVRELEDNSCELIRTDGTPEGSETLKDISPDNSLSYSIGPTATLGSTLYFIVERSGTGHQLWKTDGTPEGTVVIEDTTGDLANATLTSLHTLGNMLYFAARIDAGSAEWWRTDGSMGGATRVASVDDSYLGRRNNDVFTLGQKLHFVAKDATKGTELWTSDGTETGTRMVSNINQAHPASWPSVALSDYRRTTTHLDGEDYFTAYDNENGWSLWRSDRTKAGTHRVKAIASHPSKDGIQDLTTLDSTVYFRVDGGYQSQLWRSDGTESGTVPILSAEGDALYEVDNLTASNGLLFFEALDKEFNSRLWRSDGTQTGTYPLTGVGSLADVIVEAPSFMVHDSALYFPASDPEHGEELWRTDGTEAGTYLVKDIYTGEEGNYLEPLGVMGAHLYFSTWEVDYGQELWRTDGTAEGTHRVKDINPGPSGSSPEDFVSLGSVAYFITYLDGYRLWRTDGTEDGTYQVTDTTTTSQGRIAAFNEYIYFSGVTSESGNELWRTDGTVGGAELLIDVHPGTYGGDPSDLTVIGNRLYFVAEPRYGSGYSTWVSDGTREGTRLVK